MTDHPSSDWRLVCALGVAQIASWGSLFYAFALLQLPLREQLGTSPAAVVGAFSLALLVAGLLSAPVGRWIDRHGGRALMSLGSLAAGLLLALLPWVQNLAQLYLLWAGLGAAMAATLYDPAFAVLARVFRSGPRTAITVLTLFGGFASTVFWPLTQLLIDHVGWRGALWTLAAINLLVCLPIHALLLPGAQPVQAPAETKPAAPPQGTRWRALFARPGFAWLCAAFTANTLVFSALSVHLLPLLTSRGLDARDAAWVGALIGPMQVLGRLVEFFLLRSLRPSRIGTLTLWLLPASLLVLPAIDGASGLGTSALLFAFLYGAGNGLMTIVRGALPAELWGREDYGAINGALATPVLLAKAAGPLAAAALLGVAAPLPLIWGMAGLGALAALLFGLAVREHRRASG
jgi:MFS family permease